MFFINLISAVISLSIVFIVSEPLPWVVFDVLAFVFNGGLAVANFRLAKLWRR